ncbi:putative methyltransferase [Cinnamomum micranthum f. kanehirae]|uniref:Putative methyltransferase n=1 Tax=Cinnamomum micranthum f. kanehirae TaxID=337451 RepID=A0A3S3P318_9MAGN|nr:putative methyltransferase [Cinnamomum micranthum f. kanehirae]
MCLTLTERPWLVSMVIFCGALLSITRLTSDYSFLCSLTPSSSTFHLDVIVHYATSHTIPQQSILEIRESLDVLKHLSPCKFSSSASAMTPSCGPPSFGSCSSSKTPPPSTPTPSATPPASPKSTLSSPTLDLSPPTRDPTQGESVLQIGPH